jgi:hypothetical protein
MHVAETSAGNSFLHFIQRGVFQLIDSPSLTDPAKEGMVHRHLFEEEL